MPLCKNCGVPMRAVNGGFICSGIELRTGVIQCPRCDYVALGMWPSGATLPFECVNCFRKEALPAPMMMAGP